jgi:mannose-6-phosphate isomerase-like protein (cupin superfamily)
VSAAKRSVARPYFHAWAERQDVPIYRGYSVPDVVRAELRPWELLGADGAIIDLNGFEGFSSCFLVEIAPRQQLRPQRHIYQQFVYALTGVGHVTVRNPGQPDAGADFESGALFGTPLNAEYVIVNRGEQPLRYLTFTDAPQVLDLYHHAEEFVFHNPAVFTERMTPWPDFFGSGVGHTAGDGSAFHVSNLVADVPHRGVDKHGGKGEGVDLTTFELAEQSWAGHIASWPVGRYHQAHHHQGGAALLIVQSVGYTLMWPTSAGPRPFEAGQAEQVVRIEWQPGTLFSPPTAWFHQHFNTGAVPARQLAFRGSGVHPNGMRRAANKYIDGRLSVYLSLRDGGNLIEPADEDPFIAKDFAERLEAETGTDPA